MAGESATRRDPGSGGFNLLDASAFVAGAATAAIHFRGVAEQVGPREGWVLLGLTYTWASVTTSGPFMMLARRYGRRVAGYPRAGDWCQTLLGLPWVVAVLMLPDPSLGFIPLKPLFSPRNPLDLGVIAVGVAFASIGAMALDMDNLGQGPATPPRRGHDLDRTGRPDPRRSLADPVRPGAGSHRLIRGRIVESGPGPPILNRGRSPIGLPCWPRRGESSRSASRPGCGARP